VSPQETNSGIVIHGGSFQADKVAVGPHATITTHHDSRSAEPQSLAQLQQQLNALLAVLDQHHGDLPNPGEVLGSAREAADELEGQRPRKEVFLRRIRTVAEGISGVVGLVGATDSLLRAAEKLL
jgi:hypothetical protein